MKIQDGLRIKNTVAQTEANLKACIKTGHHSRVCVVCDHLNKYLCRESKQW